MTRHDLLPYAVLIAVTWGGLALGVSLWVIMSVAIAVALLREFVLPAPRARARPAPTSSRAVARESGYEVRFDDETLAVTYDGAPRGQVNSSRLRFVGIRIDDAFLPQPWWLLADSKRGCMFPSDARGWQDALRAMGERLPGFDYNAVIRAMGMMSGGVVVWKHADPSVPLPHLKA